jgi:hypothetical protein
MYRMNESQMLERLASTDAYAPETDMPPAAWSHDVAFSEVERRIGLQPGVGKPSGESVPTWRRGWIVAMAAFAVAIIVIGVAMLFSRPANELPPATTPPTTEVLPPTTTVKEEATEGETVTTVAEVEFVMTDEVVALLDSYEAAFNARDEAAFRSFFAPDFWRADPSSLEWKQSVEYMVNMMLNSRVQETTLSIEDCTPSDEGAQCKFKYAGAVEQALYFGPIIDTVQVHIVEGKIPDMLITEWETGDLQERSGQKVLDWVEENFPEDRPKMAIVAIGVVNDQFGLDPVEVLELWSKYVPLWAEAGRP